MWKRDNYALSHAIAKNVEPELEVTNSPYTERNFRDTYELTSMEQVQHVAD